MSEPGWRPLPSSFSNRIFSEPPGLRSQKYYGQGYKRNASGWFQVTEPSEVPECAPKGLTTYAWEDRWIGGAPLFG